MSDLVGWLRCLFGGCHACHEMKGDGNKMAKDPVCGMEVDEQKAAGKSEYKSMTYYFCAVGCKKTFDENPAKYVVGKGEMKGSLYGH